MDNYSEPGSDAQSLLNQIVLEYMRDKKRARMWRYLKRGVLLLIACVILYMFYELRHDASVTLNKPHVGLIDLKGEIFDNNSASADYFIRGLNAAYKNKSMRGLIIRIDSPGGSPVQADYMYQAIKQYSLKNSDIKIIAVCVDACASAAYYVASAAQDIYANPSSLVGSIGVLYNGFGFVDALQKLGVSRRLQTSGKNKGFLDPFLAENPAQVVMLQKMLDLIHQEFIDKVKAGRGSRLKIDDDTFSGLFWTGIQAKERGLIDGFASSGQVAREIFKLDKVVDYTYEPNVLEKLAGRVGTSLANQLPMALGLKPRIELAIKHP